jgi:hypothetical protein
MKTFQFRLNWIALVATLTVSSPAGEVDQFVSDAIRDRLNLLPASQSGLMAGSHSLKSLKGLPIEARKVFSQKDDGDWKTFADDVISFEIPADPLLRVNALTPESQEPIRIVGGAVGTVDRSFQRAYYITVDRAPYLTVFVRDADWFDTGMCLCGSIVFERFIAIDGNLLKFGFLHDGNVKKAEALGGRHRAIMLEWTHSSITQPAYARIARSLRLSERNPRTQKEWTQRMREADPNKSMFGWLEIDDSPKRVREIVGEPSKIDGETWIYVKERRDSDGSGYRVTTKVPMKGGKFGRFEAGWRQYQEFESPKSLLNRFVDAVKDLF